MGDAKAYRKHNQVHIVGTYNGRDYEAYASDKANCYSFGDGGDIGMSTLYVKDGSQPYDACDMELEGESNEKTAAAVAIELRRTLEVRERKWSE